MTRYFDRDAVVLACASLAVALIVNECNVSLIRTFNPANVPTNCASLQEDQVVYNVDSYAHTTTVESFLAGRGWRVRPYVGRGSYFRRTPGTGLVYLVFRCLQGVRGALFAFKAFSLTLFFLSVMCIYGIALWSYGTRRMAGLITLLYGCTPFFSSYCYYVLTESLSPYLMVFYLYFLLRAWEAGTWRRKAANYGVAGCLLGYAVLTRPYLAVGSVLLPTFIAKDWWSSAKEGLRVAVMVGIVPLGMMLAWTARNYYRTGEFVPLEKAYHPESLDYMKPSVRGILAFIKSWGEDLSFGFHVYHGPLFSAALNGDRSDVHVERVLDYWPKEVVAEFGHDRLAGLLRRYQAVVYSQASYFRDGIAMPSEYSREEIAIEAEFDEMVKEYRRAHFFRYWVETPLIYLRRMVFHSNTSNLLIFHPRLRDSRWRNAWRLSLAGLHIAAYAALLMNILFLKDGVKRAVHVYFPLLVILFFIVVHREYEQRYMLPVLPYLIVGMGYPLRRGLQSAGELALRVRRRRLEPRRSDKLGAFVEGELRIVALAR